MAPPHILCLLCCEDSSLHSSIFSHFIVTDCLTQHYFSAHRSGNTKLVQGVIRHDVVEKTDAAIHALLEFLHLRNLELRNADDDADADASPSVLDRLEETYPSGAVPCYRSAPAVRPGELSGKISWPNDPANPNFPALVVHESVQDRDFEPLRAGDPLFVTLDGTVVPYDGSHGEEVHLIFVNEGGYYYESSGTGIGVAVKSRFDWQTGERKDV